jgi:DeoR/GlpR family transcriptional regulator of sugar metabolism
MIFRQIARRFGTVPVTIRRQIEKIDKIKQLERIADGLLEVKDLKQLRKLVGPNGKFA